MTQDNQYQMFAWVEKNRLNKLFKIAWPITLGMLASNVLTLIDTAMVGHLGPQSLAAVAVGGVFNSIVVTTVLGLGIGVQAITARRIGEKALDRAANALHGGLLVGSSVGLVVAALSYFLAPTLMLYYPATEDVIAEAIPYFKVMAVIIPAIGMNASFRGFFNGIGRTKIYMATLVSVVALNIFLNWVLIFGNLGAPALGTVGAGMATGISMYTGTIIYFIWCFRVGKPYGFFKRLPSKETVSNLIKLAIPSMTNQMLTSFGSMVYFGIIATLGEKDLAATTIVFRLAMVLVLPAFGLAMGGAALVGHSLGAKQPDDAKNWGWDTAKVGALLLTVMGLPLVFFPGQVAYLFVQDPETVALALMPLRLVGLTMGFNGCGVIFIQCLNGAGDNKFVLKGTSGFQWCCGLPFIAFVALYLDAGLTWIWAAQVTNYFALLNIFSYRWRSGKWAQHRL